MYHRILVPLDGSDTAQRGLAEASALACQLGAKLRLYHVIDPLVAYIGMSSLVTLPANMDDLREAGRNLLQHEVQRLVLAGRNVDCRLEECAAPNVGQLILDEAKRWPADLIAMGTHGRRGIRLLVLGSDAEYVVRHSPIPVLLVRATE